MTWSNIWFCHLILFFHLTSQNRGITVLLNIIFKGPRDDNKLTKLTENRELWKFSRLKSPPDDANNDDDKINKSKVFVSYKTMQRFTIFSGRIVIFGSLFHPKMNKYVFNFKFGSSNIKNKHILKKNCQNMYVYIFWLLLKLDQASQNLTLKKK